MTMFLLSSLLFCFFACNESIKNNDVATVQSDTATFQKDSLKIGVTNSPSIVLDKNCVGNANFYITKDTADSLRSHFKNHFRVKVNPTAMKSFVDSIWIDACVINAIGNFFDTAKNDGMRIYFGAEFTPAQKNRNTIMLVPTYRNPGGDQSHLHKDDWVTKPNLVCNMALFQNFNKPYTYVDPLIQHFGRFYRELKNPGNPSAGVKHENISSSVWLSGCVFIYLRNLIKQYTPALDGVYVYAAAHYYIAHGSYQSYSDQTTLLLVPTNADGGNHKPNWDAVQRSTKFTEAGALNHGQLCPTQCNN